MSDTPPPSRDPRLEIPEVLRTPVKRPEHMTTGEPLGGRLTSDSDAIESAKGWAIALNFVYGVIAGTLIGWAIQAWLTPQWAPWPLLIGMGAGLIGGFIRFIREGIRANNAPLPRKK